MPRLSPFLAVVFLGQWPAPAAPLDFAHDVVPILREHCAECHTGEKKKGGLSMNARRDLLAGSENGPVLEVGKAEASKLIQLVTSTDPEAQMPPKGARLSAEQVATLKAWIDAGVPWDDGFAFKKPAYEPPLKPRRPELPAAVDGREHPIDRLLDAHLAQQNLPRPAALDDAGFLRRVHLDLLGQLPEPEALASFLADASPDKRGAIIRELLANDLGYAEHWLTFWNDLLRNDYVGTGYIDGGRKQISAWLYRALLENKPYDQFARELISPTPESEGFGRGIKWRGVVSAGQVVPVQFAQSVGQSFLGINLKCASCHNSFIDRWKLDDSYGLAAIFAEEPLELHRCDKPMGRTAKAAWLFPEIGQVDSQKPRAERLAQLAGLMTHPENGRFARTMVNRLWHRLMGHGIVHPVDAMQTEPWNADLLDFLATHLADGGYDLKKTLALICSSQAYQSQAAMLKESAEPYRYAGPRAKRLTAEQFVDALWQITSTAPGKIDAPVQRGKRGQHSVALTAHWVWSSDNRGTLPAAGEAITLRKQVELKAAPQKAAVVITCDNSFVLYLNGKKIGQGDNWQTAKAYDLAERLHAGPNEFTIVAKNAGKDPNNAGVFLEARVSYQDGSEQIIATDASWWWTVATPNERGRFAQEPADWRPAARVHPEGWTDRVGAELAAELGQLLHGQQPMVRASLLKSDLLMRALGRPNREQIVSTRPNDLTTLEAMDLSNGQILTTRLEAGSSKLLERSWTSSQTLVDWLYRYALSRPPTEAELALALEVLGEKPSASGLQDLLWAVVMLPEFQLVR